MAQNLATLADTPWLVDAEASLPQGSLRRIALLGSRVVEEVEGEAVHVLRLGLQLEAEPHQPVQHAALGILDPGPALQHARHRAQEVGQGSQHPVPP